MRFILFSVLIFLASCQMDNPKKEVASDAPAKPLSNEKDFERRILDIDAKTDQFEVGNSLFYTHNDQSTEEVFAYMDKGNKIVKLEEVFYDAPSGNRGTRTFYLFNSKKFASVEKIVDKVNNKGNFIERVSYYNFQEQVLYTKQRESEYESDIDKSTFHPVKSYNCSMDRARQVLNQEGPFRTTFQGFVENGPMEYILVGGEGEKGFASALAIQYKTEQIEFLKKNEKSSVNTPLMVEFEKMMDDRSYQFQVLLNLQILTK